MALSNSKNKSSEFGRGLCICLVKFAEHCERDQSLGVIYKWMKETPENQKAMLLENPPDKLNFGSILHNLKSFVDIANKIYEGDFKKAMSHRIEMVMNGASDHLYEIQVPGEPFWDDIRIAVDLLRTKALAMGHGFTGQIWTIEDLIEVRQATRDVAMMIDKRLYLEPEEGEW
jgi:hypothetical protein